MLYKIFQICTTLPVFKISAQPDIVYWSCYPKTPESRSNWVLNQKKTYYIFQVKLRTTNTQKSKLEIQNVQRNGPIIDSVKLFGTTIRGSLDQFGPHQFFVYLFIYYFFLGGGWGRLQESGDFSGTLKLFYLIFHRMQFLQKFWFIATFLVFQQYIGPQNGPKL